MTINVNNSPEKALKTTEVVVSQPAEATTDKNNQKTDTPPAVPTETPTETHEQIHWRKFREIRETERQAKQESDRIARQKTEEAEALKIALESVLNKKPDPDEPIEEDEVDQKIRKAIEAHDKKAELARIERERKEEPERLSRTFPDFEKVCSPTNIDYLEFHHPEAFAAFKAMPDSVEKWTKVYHAMKRYVPSSDVDKDTAKMEANLKKPQAARNSLTQTGETAPISYLSESKKQDNWRRMQRSLKSVN